MKTWRILLAVCLIFAAGAVTGALIARRIAPAIAKKEKQPPPMPPQADHRKGYLDRLDSKLSLTPEQRQQVDRILKDSQERMKQLWGSIEPQAKEEYRRTRKEISDLLTPEQNEIYKAMRRDRDREKGEGKGDGKKDHDGKTDEDKTRSPSSAWLKPDCRCC